MISSGLAAKSLKDLTNVQEARAVSAASLRGVKRRAERPRWTGRRAGGGAGRKRASRGWPRAGMRAADDVGERRGRASAANAARRGRGKGRRRTNRIGDYGGGSGFRGGGMRRRVSRNGGRRGHSTRHRGKAGGRDAACEGSAARRRTGRGPAEPPRLAAAGESTDRRSGDQVVRWSGGQVVRWSGDQTLNPAARTARPPSAAHPPDPSANARRRPPVRRARRSAA
ncbi:Uncharacterised protein [Burkholderia pseudomallei]|nr:Uncharacterised protein [Burkholderia pseudomallei]